MVWSGQRGLIALLLVTFSVGRPQGGGRVCWDDVVCLHLVPVFKRFATYVAVCCCSFHGSCSAPVVTTVECLLLCFAFRAVHLTGSALVTVRPLPCYLVAFQTRFSERHGVWDFSLGGFAGLHNPHVHHVDEVAHG